MAPNCSLLISIECEVLPNLQSEPHWPPFWLPCGSVLRYPESTEGTCCSSKTLKKNKKERKKNQGIKHFEVIKLDSEGQFLTADRQRDQVQSQDARQQR